MDEIKVTVSRDGAIVVQVGQAPVHHVGFVNRAPGNRWESTTKSGRTVARSNWTKAEAVAALVNRYYPSR